MLKPAQRGIFPIPGSGRQYMPRIHITDLYNIYLKTSKDDKMEGAYNAVAPQHVTFREFMSSLPSVFLLFRC
jgi:NAD dependent epimerase/dehydratase family enzyme